MSLDLIAFLSGNVPGGIWLLSALLIFFSLICYFIWHSIGFWGKARLSNIMIKGWAVIFILYAIVWFYHRPPPIPTRIIVRYWQPDTVEIDTWRSLGLSDA